MEMTVDLFDSIINTSQDCVFWKDKKKLQAWHSLRAILLITLRARQTFLIWIAE